MAEFTQAQFSVATKEKIVYKSPSFKRLDFAVLNVLTPSTSLNEGIESLENVRDG
jgi:hypothetical protein